MSTPTQQPQEISKGVVLFSAPEDALVAKQGQDDLETHSVLVWHPREG